MPALREIFAEYDVVFDRRRNLQRGNRMVSRMGSALRRMRGPVVSATQALGAMAAAAGVAAAAGLQQIVTSTIESTREIDRWSGRLDVSTESLRSWIELGREYGASVDDVTDSIKELQLKAQDALAGGTEQAEMFERIGISLADLRPVINDSEALFRLFTDSLNENVTAGEQMFAVDEIRSDSGVAMLPILRLGTAEIDRRRTALTQSLGPMEGLNIAVENHIQRVIEVTRRWERFKRMITANVLPILGQISERVSAFEEPARRMIEKVMKIARETYILKGALIGVAAAAIVTAALTIGAWGPAVLAFIGVTVAVAGVAWAYDQVTRSLEGSDTALKTFLKDYFDISSEEIRGAALILGDGWERLTTRIMGAGEAIRSFMEEIQPLVTIVEGLWWMITAMSGGGIVEALGGSLWEQAGPALRDATQARTAEEDERRAPGEARATRNAQAVKGESTDTWTGQRLDEFGNPMSAPEGAREPTREPPPRGTPWRDPGEAAVPTPTFARSREIPTISRSAAISETRVPRPESSSQQTVAVEAPMTLNFDISEATDIQGIERLVTRGVSEGISRWNSELESLISDQTEVGT